MIAARDLTLEEIVKALPQLHKARAEWEQLMKDSWFLDCLHGAGVDNWDGYEEAIDMRQTLGEPL